jgi:hypothetical protein
MSHAPTMSRTVGELGTAPSRAENCRISMFGYLSIAGDQVPLAADLAFAGT